MAQTLMRRTDGQAMATPCDTCFAGGQPRAWGAPSVRGMYVCGGCGCGCVHTHTPQVAWHGGGVRECCLQGESSAHALNMTIRLTEPRRGPPIPVLPFQSHPRQTSQASPTSLSPPGSIRKRTLKTQKREEPRVEGATWSRSEALPTLLWAALVRTYHLKPLKLWGCLLQHLYGPLQSSRGLNYLK